MNTGEILIPTPIIKLLTQKCRVCYFRIWTFKRKPTLKYQMHYMRHVIDDLEKCRR